MLLALSRGSSGRMQGERVANTPKFHVHETLGIRPKLSLTDYGSATAEMPWPLGGGYLRQPPNEWLEAFEWHDPAQNGLRIAEDTRRK